MAQHFKFVSIQQFATEILKGSSSQRLDWLRQYYASLNGSDVFEAVRAHFPDATAEPSSPTTANLSSSTTAPDKTVQIKPSRARKTRKLSQTRKSQPRSPQKHSILSPQIGSDVLKDDAYEPPKKPRMSEKNLPDHLQDVRRVVLEEQEEIVYSAGRHSKTQKNSVSTGACKAGGGLAVEQASSLGQGSGEAVVGAPLNHTDRDAPSSSDPKRFNSAKLSRPTVQEREQEQKSSLRTGETLQESCKPPSTSCSSSLLKDLIGDPSILDDLLKPKSRSLQQKSKSKTPASSVTLNPNLITSSSPKLPLCSDSSSKTPTTALVQTSKRARKDIWDILSEGNEESLNRLTDPEEVQKVCINSSFLARDFSGHKESTTLWKTNDKFLWKK